MEIQVLQGLNLQNNGSTIIIELVSPIPVEIIEKIKGFHPVFMDDFKLEDKKLTINSKLTHLWVEIGKALQKLSNRDWSYDYTLKYILEEVINKQVKSMSTIPILYSAIQEGLEITQYYLDAGISEDSDLNRRYIIGCGAESNQVCSFSSSKDTYLAFMTQRDKTLTNQIIERLNIPTPKWVEIKSKEDIEKHWEEFTKPVVIKPAGLTGGNGVVTKINTKEEAFKALEFANQIINAKERQKYQYKILMQEQVKGEDYRILVIDGKFRIATKRIPAFVTGDGKNNLSKLIKLTNADPRRDITNPTHTLKPIQIDDSLTDFLKEQDLTIEYTPKKDERVFLRKVASMSKGGITEDFTDMVHPQIKAICETLATSIHAYSLGVDVLCVDISKPLTVENGAIIECNTMPEAYLNSFPLIGKQYNDIGMTFLEGLISKNKTKKIVFIGKELGDVKSFLNRKLATQEINIGTYSKEKIYFNDQEINSSSNLTRTFEALKLNASLNTIVHHLSKDELEKYGTGFERIDLLVIDKNELKLYNQFEGMKNIGLIYEVETF